MSSAKLVEKKSSFFAYAYPIESEDDVKEIIQNIKTKHKQANHIAYAFKLSKVYSHDKILSEQRYDDAGEPSKTAGFPLLRILEQKRVTNTLLVVARVFGGVKLGTAGLIKAYGGAGRLALTQGTLESKPISKRMKLTVPLPLFSRLEKFFKQHKLEHAADFSSDEVSVEYLLPLGQEDLIESINGLLYKG